MAGKVRAQGEQVRRFILDAVDAHASDLAGHVAQKLSITRQAVNKHLRRLMEQGAITRQGTGRSLKYALAPLGAANFTYSLAQDLEEDLVWTRDIRPSLEHLPGNVLNIWHHGFTEMFNNAIDHSGGTVITVEVTKTAASTEILLADDGVGIFKKIQRELDLLDERHAIFELSKGKLTTDPRNHSGEGIFFTSRMFDRFEILSGGLYFDHDRDRREDWLSERQKPGDGTGVFMVLSNHTARTTKKVFDEFSSGDDYAFNKTIVPVSLARYGTDELVSRSQAKRLLARVELFKKVVFDFKGIDAIGQAFSDQIFRVFAAEHPDIELVPIHMTKAVKEMVDRAKARDRSS